MKSVAYLVALVAFTASATGQGWEGKCVKVDDGDTIMVCNEMLSYVLYQRPGGLVKIRLWGVNCPERKDALSKEAKTFTMRMVKGKKVTIKTAQQGYDKYGRIVAEVFVDGKSLNQELLREGYARWVRKYAWDNLRYQSLDESAKRAQKGLWGLDEPPHIH